MSLYERAELYDIAFSYRDIGAETNALSAWYRSMTGQPGPKRVLELGAGPAQHAREFARRGAEAWALDLSPTMSDYAREQAVAEGLRLETVTGDMTGFELPRRFDLILLMLNSVSHVLTESAMVRHLECVAHSLTPGGIYVMEVAHPADDDAHPEGEPPRQWTARRGQTVVDIQFGQDGDPLEHSQRIRTHTVTLNASISGHAVSYVEQLRLRAWKRQAIDEAIQRAGGFGQVRIHGDFAPEVSFEHPEAWRMIYVLQRADGPQR